MKILIFANYDVGLYQFRRELIEALLKEHEVTIALPYGELVDRLVEAGCTFINVPMNRRGINPAEDLSLMRRFGAVLSQVRPDLVITYTIKPNIYGSFLCRLRGIPCAANITGLGTAFEGSGLLRRMVTQMYKTALKKNRVVFFENAVNKELFEKEGIIGAKQGMLLPGAGVNLERYQPQPYPEDSSFRFLFMGRVMKEKGIDELIAAMRRLNREGAACALDVLGPSEEDYSALLGDCEKEGWLKFHGYQVDVRPFIAAAHCFVLPSWHEGMANTNLECAASARPVITSNIPGCREAVVPGETGFLCEAKNADSLYAAMKEMLSLSPARRAEMGRAGRAHMEAVFDKRRVVERTIAALGL